jgi:hypothetical protein
MAKTPVIADDDISLLSDESTPILSSHKLDESLRELKEYNYLLDKVKCSKIKFIKLLISGVVGIGTGLAMLPIFDDEVNELDAAGINIDKYNIASISVSVNTLLLFSSVATITIYHYLQNNSKEKSTELQKLALEVGKVASMCATILPVSQLWAIELENQEITGTEGFNEYIAWATATTVPLCIFKSIESYEYVRDFVLNKLDHIDLNNVGSKLFVYMPTVLSSLGRFISYSASGAFLAESLGLSEEFSWVIGALIGGIAGSGVVAIAEHNSLKYLFEKSDKSLTLKQKLGATICTLEGVLLTLPIVTTGMEAVDSWSPLVKGLIFAPLFVSHTVLEARSIYKAFEYLFHKPYGNEKEYMKLETISVVESESLTDIEAIGDSN